MNIIKFQDIVIENDTVFNEQLKNKYMLVINWKWLVDLSFDFNEYILYSQKDEKPENSIDLELYIDYVDLYNTENANGVSIWVSKNAFTPDSDITIEELKIFRRWLAKLILDVFEVQEDEKIMLNYYVNDMYDDIIKSLSIVNTQNDILSPINTACDCCSNSYSIIYNGEFSDCDPILVYMKNIYNVMVKYFSDLNYWIDKKDICEDIKKYIDNIIKLDFPLTKSTWIESYSDCTCVINNSQHESYKSILNRLSKIFGWIYNDKISGHKNEANTVLNIWATELFENMQW